MHPKVVPSRIPKQGIGRDPKQEYGRISLIGRNAFQNNLMKTVLEAELHNSYHISQIPCWPIGEEALEGEAYSGVVHGLHYSLLLWDCFNMDDTEIWRQLGVGGAPDPAEQPIALFNADQDLGQAFERRAIEKNIRGVFRRDDSPGQFLKGVSKILQGELWFSRKTTSDMLIDMQHRGASMAVAEAMLTNREKEILFAIAGGASNSDIATEFFISLHTVKTHLYNIYKKIDVKNRLEATLWVVQYL